MARYSLAFPKDPNSLPYNLYKKLRTLKIDDAAMDRGTLVINSNGTSCHKPADASCTVGRGNLKITPEEVFDTAFELADTDLYFAHDMFTTFKIKIPWIWSVLDPIVPKEDMGAFWNYIKFLKSSLQNRNLVTGSPEFRDALALGIYYYVVAPKRDFVGEWGRFEIAEKELTALGWQDIKDYLKTNGGLFTARGNGRPTVLESVEQGELQTAHMTMILYSALQVAGIPATFMLGEGKTTKDPESFQSDIYVCVQVPSATGFRMMDPYDMQSDAHYGGFTAISPRQMFGVYQAFLSSKSSTLEEMRGHLDLGSIIDPQSPFVHGAWGMYWIMQQKPDEAETEIERAIAFAPQLSVFYDVRASVMAGKGKFDKALSGLDHAHALSPMRHNPVLNQAVMYAHAGSWDRSLSFYLKVNQMSDDELLDVIRQSIQDVATRLWRDVTRMPLKKQIKDETTLDAADIEASLVWSRFLWEYGRPKTAVKLLTAKLRLLPHPETYTEPVRKELHRLIAILPPAMRDDVEAGTAIARIP